MITRKFFKLIHAAIAFVAIAVFGRTAAFGQDTHWVGTWGCGIQLTEPRNLPPPPGPTSNTLRQIVHSSIDGKQLRVHFSNIFGTNPVVINWLHLNAIGYRTMAEAIDLKLFTNN